MVTATPLDDQNRKTILRVLKRLLLYALLSLPFFYLFQPLILLWYKNRSTPAPVTIPDPVVEDHLLDFFIVRDASLSPDQSHYEQIESAIFSRLDIAEGDRVSYAAFGARTFPDPVQPPSADRVSIEAQRSAARTVRFTTTDFVALFDNIQKAIQGDRERQLGDKKPQRADAVIIISDGVPDPHNTNQSCPGSDPQFIPDDVVESFDAMINSAYATQEPIYVRMILAGTDSVCGPRIKEEWERRLGTVASRAKFQVLSYTESLSQADEMGPLLALLTTLRRHPRIVLYLYPLEDVDRSALDAGEMFSVSYSAQSFLNGGRLHIRYGSVTDEKGDEQVRLFALKNDELSVTDGNRVDIVVGAPARGSWGVPDKDVFYLKPERPDVSIDDSKTYQLRLKVDSASAVEIKPHYLPMQPCNKATQKAALRTRLRRVNLLVMTVGAVFLAGFFCWLYPLRGIGGRAQSWIDRVFFESKDLWLRAIIILILSITLAGFYCAPGSTLLYVGSGIAAFLPLLNFAFKEHLKTRLLVHAGDSIIHPIVVETAVNHISQFMG